MYKIAYILLILISILSLCQAKENNDKAKGAVVGVAKNAAQYTIDVGNGGRKILNIYDNTMVNLKGNKRLWLRYDIPHGSTPYHHININPAVSGVKDTHSAISSIHAAVAKPIGKVFQAANTVAPFLTAAVLTYDAVDLYQNVKKDIEERTTTNTVMSVSKKAGVYGGGYAGATTGATVGSMVLPGLGTMGGAIVGALIGGSYGGAVGEAAGEDLNSKDSKIKEYAYNAAAYTGEAAKNGENALCSWWYGSDQSSCLSENPKVKKYIESTASAAYNAAKYTGEAAKNGGNALYSWLDENDVVSSLSKFSENPKIKEYAESTAKIAYNAAEFADEAAKNGADAVYSWWYGSDNEL